MLGASGGPCGLASSRNLGQTATRFCSPRSTTSRTERGWSSDRVTLLLQRHVPRQIPRWPSRQISLSLLSLVTYTHCSVDHLWEKFRENIKSVQKCLSLRFPSEQYRNMILLIETYFCHSLKKSFVFESFATDRSRC